MSEVEFKAWGKIPRGAGDKITITEKIDGTNACIVIVDGEIVGVQSRKRFITPEDDNFGFAQWVVDHNDELLSLGDGYHYGEWAGEGIQKNKHKINGKKFFLFNTLRWNEKNTALPDCCDVVPVLYVGDVLGDDADREMEKLLVSSGKSGYEAEGIIIYFKNTRRYEKHTFKFSKGKWNNQ